MPAHDDLHARDLELKTMNMIRNSNVTHEYMKNINITGADRSSDFEQHEDQVLVMMIYSWSNHYTILII